MIEIACPRCGARVYATTEDYKEEQLEVYAEKLCPRCVQPGDRVCLVRCTDAYTKLEPNALGTVSFIDSLGTVFVSWDDGHTLGLMERAGDRFEVVRREER